MKFNIRPAQVTIGEQTFVDKTKVEMGWKHGEQGCLYIVPKSNWKTMLKAARQGKAAFAKHLKGL